MQPSRIIVHADGTPTGIARALSAHKLATQFGARTQAVLVFHEPLDPYGPGAVALSQMVRAHRDALESEIDAASKALAKAVDRTEIVLTRVDRTRLEAASLFRAGDLLVVGPPTADVAYLKDDVFFAALFMSGRPCIVLPAASAAVSFGKRIVIAWKDCREAARAVHDAMPFLVRAEGVSMVAVKPDWDATFAGQKAFDRVAETLRDHGVKLERVSVEPKRDSTHETLSRAVGDYGADMLVMGGYGRARFREFLFGGVTRGMIEALPCPTLMSH